MPERRSTRASAPAQKAPRKKKRAPAVVAASVAGFAGVLALHTSSQPSLLGGSSSPVSPAVGTPTTVPTTSPPATNPSASSTTAPAGATGTAVGNQEQYGYGVLAVKVTSRAGRIVDVSVTTLQTAEQYSQQLAQQVIPMLRNEVLSAQSARINGISGATYTSQAYAASVQSALDRLRAK